MPPGSLWFREVQNRVHTQGCFFLTLVVTLHQKNIEIKFLLQKFAAALSRIELVKFLMHSILSFKKKSSTDLRRQPSVKVIFRIDCKMVDAYERLHILHK